MPEKIVLKREEFRAAAPRALSTGNRAIEPSEKNNEVVQESEIRIGNH